MKAKHIIFLFLATVLLTIFPLSWEIQRWLPNWLLLVTLLFVYRYPVKMTLGVVCLIGLFQDVLLGNFLGSEALLFVLFGYLFRYFSWYTSTSSGFSRSVFFCNFWSYMTTAKLPSGG